MEPRTVSTGAYFLALPTEVRELIYQYCFTGVKGQQYKSLHYEHQEPGLTKVSKSVRAESLPFHYAACVLDIYNLVRCGYHQRNIGLTKSRWYHNLTPARIGLIRTIKLRFSFSEWYFGEFVTIEFMIKLDKRNQAYSLGHSFRPGWYSDPNRKGDPADCEEVLQVLTRHITSSLRLSLSEKGVGNFDHADVDRLTDVDPDRIP